MVERRRRGFRGLARPLYLLFLVHLLLVACLGGTPAVVPLVTGFQPEALRDVGGPDRATVLRDPRSEDVEAARSWLSADEAVVAVEVGGRARAYPIAVLMIHAVVNDVVGGRAIVVSWSPLTNSASVFDRDVGPGPPATFIDAGKRYHSGVVLLDERTRSLWPQLLTRAVLGELKGTRLTAIPASVVAFGDFAGAFPDGDVLSRPGPARYGINPYEGYDQGTGPYDELLAGQPDPRLPALARVVGVRIGSAARAYGVDDLRALGDPAVVHDRLGSRAIVVFHGGEQRSVLDAPTVAGGRSVGSTTVFDPRVEGRELRFAVVDGAIVDDQTASRWSILGVATDGPLAGTRLSPVTHIDAFWFAWASVAPRADLWRAAVG